MLYEINQHAVFVESDMSKPANLSQNALSQLSPIIEAYHGIFLLRFFVTSVTPHLVIQHRVVVELGM